MKSGLERPAISRAFDGTASLLGVVIYLLFTHPALIFPVVLSGAVSSALSMGGGEWLSDSGNGFTASGVMALATFCGALLPAVPFALGTGPAPVAESGVLYGSIAIIVAAFRTNRGLGLALAETFGRLAVILAVTAACGLILPGGAL